MSFLFRVVIVMSLRDGLCIFYFHDQCLISVYVAPFRGHGNGVLFSVINLTMFNFRNNDDAFYW